MSSKPFICWRGWVWGEPDSIGHYLNLSSASGASIADSRGVGTIRDDDAAPRMTVDDARVREGNRGLTRMAFVVAGELTGSARNRADIG